MLAGLPAGVELLGAGVGLATVGVGVGAGLVAVGVGDGLGGLRARVAALAVADSTSITPHTQSALVTRCELLIIISPRSRGQGRKTLAPSDATCCGGEAAWGGGPRVRRRRI